MKQIKLTEQEKLNILKQHSSKILVEETKGKTIADIQQLLGVKVDNILGPQTLAAIEQKLGTIKSGTPNVDGITYDILKKVGWTDDQIGKDPKYKSLLPTTTKGEDTTTTTKQVKPIEIPQVKVGGLKVDGGKVTGVTTSTTQDKSEEKVSDTIDSRNV